MSTFAGARRSVLALSTEELRAEVRARRRCKDCGWPLNTGQHIIECDGNGWDVDVEVDE